MKAELYKSECEQELLKRVVELIDCLECTFFNDWDYTEEEIKEYVSRYGKVPKILDAQEAYANWGNKEASARAYLDLKTFLIRAY